MGAFIGVGVTGGVSEYCCRAIQGDGSINAIADSALQGLFEGASVGLLKYVGKKMNARKAIKAKENPQAPRSNLRQMSDAGKLISDDIAKFASEAGEGLSREGFGKLSGKSFNITEEGLARVKDHINSNNFAPFYGNTEMLKRLENALKAGESISGADASYYLHELKECALMQSGMTYEDAHKAALKFFEVSDFSVYHPDVIRMRPEEWTKGWKEFWGIT